MTAEPRLLDELDTPLGRLLLHVDLEGRLCRLDFTDDSDGNASRMKSPPTLPPSVAARDPGGWTTALGRYFSGQLRAFEGLPIAEPGTPFQRLVWSALREIPIGISF